MFQTLLQLLQCNRRLTKSTPSSQSERKVKIDNKRTKANKHSGFSDASTTDYASDHHRINYSEDSEATDSPSTSFQAPPGLAPPPGLNLEADLPWRREQAGRRLTVPCQTLLHQSHQKQASNDSFVALKEVLDKLAPTEIAAVRSLLDSRAGHAGSGAHSRNSRWSTSVNPVGSHPQRPFTASGANAYRPNHKPKMKDVDRGETLQTFLAELALIEDSRVVSIRKINALGFDSGPMLQDYFSKFGAVERVMVAPTRVTSQVAFGKPRARPPCLGFVVMQTSEAAEAILKHGETHSLAGVDIKACPFQSHSIDGKD